MFSLKEMFGNEVKVTLDESWYCKWPKSGGGRTEEEKLWRYQIKGKKGLLYIQNETTLCVQTTHRIGTKLLNLLKNRAQFKRMSERKYEDIFELTIPLECARSIFRYIKPIRPNALKLASIPECS